MPATSTPTLRLLPQGQWQAAAAAHERRVDAWVQPHLERRRRGEAHAVHDFLFTYYSLRPAQLRRWHPGVGTALLHAEERLDWPFYAPVADDAAGLDVRAYLSTRGDTVRWIRDLIAATAGRQPHLGCFGMHEWAMVYRAGHDDIRHQAFPLRLGAEGTDRVVENARIRCSHFDAFRFFTADARPLNVLQPTRADQPQLEQPGCLHAAMDCYKWAFKLGPAVPGELLGDCFELALEVRELDMRASPYDLSALGYTPVEVETAAGRADYVEAQRAFAERAQSLRRRLVQVCDAVLATS
jgi:hypothetical protein